jgi:hypothetical protein
MKFLTRKGFLIEEQGMTYLADTDPDFALRPPANGGLHLPHRAPASGGPAAAARGVDSQRVLVVCWRWWRG